MYFAICFELGVKRISIVIFGAMHNLLFLFYSNVMVD